MSLINEALKKAQRVRTADTADSTPPTPGGGRIAKRRQARSPRTLLLFAAGGLVLVGLSVVATAFLLNQPEPPRPVVIIPAGDADAPVPVIVPPIIAAPAAEPAAAPTSPASAPVADGAPAPTPAPAPDLPLAPATPDAAAEPAPAPAVPEPVPAPSAPPPQASPASPAEAPAAPVPEPRILAYVDALRITGVRPAGDDSRVLMNEQVYRLDAIVDRPLGLRLTKVEADHVVFTDANGATYTKYF